MSKKNIPTCSIVIDASIAEAAGSVASPPPSAELCREFLMAVRGSGHRLAWSLAIKAEWDRHIRLFAEKWLASMVKLRKVRVVQDEAHELLREAIQTHPNDPFIVSKMLKDAHLFEAALATDRRIASLDDNARRHFGWLAATFAALESILWANPVGEGSAAVDWLENGAPEEQSRRLSARQ
jgi:hypothetical protein